MTPLLLSSAIVVLLFLMVVNWKIAIITGGLVGALAYLIGLQFALTLLVGYGVLLLIMEAGTALLAGLVLLGISSVLGTRLATLAVILLGSVMSFLIFFGLSHGEKSSIAGLKDFGTIIMAVLLSAVSNFVSRIELIGTLSSPRHLFERGFSLFPGRSFTEGVREDFVRRGAKYAREGAVEVEKSPETLVREIRLAHNGAGQFLSDGEANIALLLALISILSLLPSALSPPIWLAPPAWMSAVLSLTILIAVALRHAALDLVLYQDITVNEGKNRLVAMSGWNRYLSNGAKILKVIAIFRSIRTISMTAYEYYMDWVFKQAIKKDGANAIGLMSQWRELTCFVIADRQHITPTDASEQLFDEDIFKDTNYKEV